MVVDVVRRDGLNGLESGLYCRGVYMMGKEGESELS